MVGNRKILSVLPAILLICRVLLTPNLKKKRNPSSIKKQTHVTNPFTARLGSNEMKMTLAQNDLVLCFAPKRTDAVTVPLHSHFPAARHLSYPTHQKERGGFVPLYPGRPLFLESIDTYVTIYLFFFLPNSKERERDYPKMGLSMLFLDETIAQKLL